ncbi:prepilin peptidase [Acerihabitans arboris]|uniref:Prepilin type IV endopeptidase peptidase domain-containing protein n=1 Tax=Acerihabitans arboris TaxID=2691583 RepID=A0A845SU53_9GAMM|nr:A24 family peptidase [Acerihabitans arboris]NDL65991.1 hypothetical protein [Acerihabitans arboris]
MMATAYITCLLLYGAMMGHLTRLILGRARAQPGCPAAWRGDLPGAGGAWAGSGLGAFHRLRAHGRKAPILSRDPRAAPMSLSQRLWRRRCEVSCVLAFLAAFPGLPAERLVSGLLFSWFLLTLSWIDYHTLRLPDRITLPFLLLGIACSLISSAWHGAPGQPIGEGYAMVPAHDSLLGALCGGGGLWLLNGLFGWLKGYAGLGGGDIKLLAGLGAWLGWQVLPLLCAGAALTGLAWWLLRRAADKEIPFGPCLSLAGWMIYIGP